MDSKIVSPRQGAEIIKAGGVVIFPTETVYGIGGCSLSELSIQKIFKAKNRPSDNPLIVHLAFKSQIKDYVSEITDIQQVLLDNFTPGPISIIFKKNNKIPPIASSNLDTIGIRIPNNLIAHEFLSFCNLPVSAPSANISSRPSATNFDMAYSELITKVDGIIDGKDSQIGIESTVVYVENDNVIILRMGYVTKTMIENVLVLNNIKANVTVKNNKDKNKVISPGILYPHYKPNCRITYFDKGNIDKDTAYMLLIDDFTNYKDTHDNIMVFKDNVEYAKNLYSGFVYFEKLGYKKIAVSKPKEDEFGNAILEKLNRAME